MQLTTPLLFATPCDDEEDNMATLCCHSDKGQMFLMTRYPDEDTVDITLDDEPATLDGLKVTLSAQRLRGLGLLTPFSAASVIRPQLRVLADTLLLFLNTTETPE